MQENRLPNDCSSTTADVRTNAKTASSTVFGAKDDVILPLETLPRGEKPPTTEQRTR
jgi:hypothetical protein